MAGPSYSTPRPWPLHGGEHFQIGVANLVAQHVFELPIECRRVVEQTRRGIVVHDADFAGQELAADILDQRVGDDGRDGGQGVDAAAGCQDRARSRPVLANIADFEVDLDVVRGLIQIVWAIVRIDDGRATIDGDLDREAGHGSTCCNEQDEDRQQRGATPACGQQALRRITRYRLRDEGCVHDVAPSDASRGGRADDD
jgi:hypothetical protein